MFDKRSKDIKLANMTCTVKLDSEDQALIQNGKRRRTEDIEKVISDNDVNKLVPILQQSVEDAILPLDTKNYTTTLHLAAKNDAKECLNELIEKIPPQNLVDLIDSPTSDGETALHVAADRFNADVMQVLLDANAYPNVRNDKGHTPLHYLAFAAKTDKPDVKANIMNCLNILLSTPAINLDALSKVKMTPLQSAAAQIRNNNKYQIPVREFCKKLIQHGATVTNDVRINLSDDFIKSVQVMPKSERISSSSSAKLYDYIIRKEPENIDEIWQSEPNMKAEIKLMANKFMGSKRMLYYIVDESNEKGVSLFLNELEADPFVKNLNGEMPLHRSLARSNVPITDALLKKMKGRGSVDLTQHSFSLLKKAMEDNTTKSAGDGLKCLKSLFDKDIDIDVNQKDSSNQTALHFASRINNQEAMSILLANGAFLGEHRVIGDQDRGTVLKSILSKTLSAAMDDCISPEKSDISENTHDDLLSPDYSLRLNYKFLLPTYTDDSLSTPHNEVSTLYNISQSRKHQEVLKHPLIQVLLFAKWQKVKLLYFLNLFIYFLFVIFLTGFMYSSKSLRILERMERTGNTTDPIGLQEQLSEYRLQRGILMFFVLLITFYIACKELFQVRTNGWKHFTILENYLELILILAVLVACLVPLPVDATRHLAAWAMVVAWYEFVLVLGRLPRLAIYITLLRHVSYNFVKLLVLFGFLIIAFSISFNIIFQSGSDLKTGDEFNDFSNFWTTLPRAIVMATGEFEYSSYTEEFNNSSAIYTFSTVLIFLVFVFLIFLVLMNVMTGLAVTDAKEIVEDAILYSLKSRLDLVFLNERFFLKMPCFKKYLHRIQILNSEDRKLVVQINKLPDSERITYWTDGGRRVGDCHTCKLDNRTCEVLRSHRLSMIESNTEAAGQDTSEEVLRMLREVKRIVEAQAVGN